MNQNPSFYTIQLLVSSQKVDLTAFAEAHNLMDDIAIYKKYFEGKEQYSVIYGMYPSYQNAHDALTKLPEEFLKKLPWVRSLKVIQKSIKNTKAHHIVNTEL